MGFSDVFSPDLSGRQREILEAVIRQHIATARPVASAELVQQHRLGVSPATIRSEMASLEELGLLMHPHTSAGRIPTDRGYRYFIESLMPHADLGADERITLSHQFRQAARGTDEHLRLAAATLARLTAEAALATLDRMLEQAEVMWTREIFYDGIDRVLAQPEFSAPERVRDVVLLLSDRSRLAQVLPPLSAGDVAVTIGSEHGVESLRPFSLVVSRYGEHGGPVGFIGVVGPTRMDYQRAIGAVRSVAALMSDLVRYSEGH